jgi:transposase
VGKGKKKPSRRRSIEIDLGELDEVVKAAKERALSEEEHRILKDAQEIISRLQPNQTDESSSALNGDPPSGEKKPRKGSGRRPRSDFPSAATVEVSHPEHKSGDVCHCGKGKLYCLKRPLYHRYFRGQTPLQVTIYLREQLRCNSCEEVFTAPLPDGVGPGSYDASARSTFAHSKYGLGLPMYRQALQYAAMGTPVSVAVIYAEIAAAVPLLQPVCDHLKQLAAQGTVAYFDDTSMPILNFEREPNDDRTGLQTTGIVSEYQDYKIALFLTGRNHAGENRKVLLDDRPPDLPKLIQMSDALSANFAYIQEDELIALCLAHGRRNFVKIINSFPDECRLVINALALIYHNDSVCRENGYSPEQRLVHHQTTSKPIMDDLKTWLDKQIVGKRVEPNNPLGKAIQYLRNHWEGLTLFLREPSAPLDSNAVERILKKVVLHRKNSLFYKTAEGAKVGDIYMTLIVTCQLNKANPHHYLTELQYNHAAVEANPEDWLPWNYKATLDRLSAQVVQPASA